MTVAKPKASRTRGGASSTRQAAVQGPSSSDGATGPIAPVLIILFALAGIGIASYLTVQHYAKLALSCPKPGWFENTLHQLFGINVNCESVTTSAYSVVGPTSIPITVPGLLWFVVSGALAVWAILSLRGRLVAPDWLPAAQLVWSILGLVFVIYLVYAEFVQLKAVCVWCTGVHILTILTFFVALVQWQRVMSRRYQTSG